MIIKLSNYKSILLSLHLYTMYLIFITLHPSHLFSSFFSAFTNNNKKIIISRHIFCLITLSTQISFFSFSNRVSNPQRVLPEKFEGGGGHLHRVFQKEKETEVLIIILKICCQMVKKIFVFTNLTINQSIESSITIPSPSPNPTSPSPSDSFAPICAAQSAQITIPLLRRLGVSWSFATGSTLNPWHLKPKCK